MTDRQRLHGKGRPSEADTHGHLRMILSSCVPTSPPPDDQDQLRPLPAGSRHLSTNSTRSHHWPPGGPCHRLAIQGIRNTWGPVLGFRAVPQLSPQTCPAHPPQGRGSQVAEFRRVSNVGLIREARWGWEGPLHLFPGPDWLSRPWVRPA